MSLLNKLRYLEMRGKLKDGRTITQIISAPAGYHIVHAAFKAKSFLDAIERGTLIVITQRMHHDYKRVSFDGGKTNQRYEGP